MNRADAVAGAELTDLLTGKGIQDGCVDFTGKGRNGCIADAALVSEKSGRGDDGFTLAVKRIENHNITSIQQGLAENEYSMDRKRGKGMAVRQHEKYRK